MTTQAYQKTLSPLPAINESPIQVSVLEKLQHLSLGLCQPPEVCTGGDQMLGNFILFMRDASWYVEFSSAIPEGDVGRVFEVMKVSICVVSRNASSYL
jgi:hypothetical protein